MGAGGAVYHDYFWLCSAGLLLCILIGILNVHDRLEVRFHRSFLMGV